MSKSTPKKRSRPKTFSLNGAQVHFDDLSLLEKNSVRALEALRRAGLGEKESRAALHEFAQAFRWYKQGIATALERPTNSVVRDELERLERRARALAKEINYASPVAISVFKQADPRPLAVLLSHAPLSIDDEGPIKFDGVKNLSLGELRPILIDVAHRTAVARASIREEKIGRPADANLVDFARRACEIWKTYGSGTVGISWNGSVGKHSGLLFDLVTKLWRMEGCKGGSPYYTIGAALRAELKSRPAKNLRKR